MRPSHAQPPPPPPHLQENRQLSRQEPQDEPEPGPNKEVPLLRSLASTPSLLRNRSSLCKQKSWSPDMFREEAWLRRKGNFRNRQSKSVTEEDLDELKGCIELGFGFDSPEVVDGRLSDTLPALGFYYAVTRQCGGSVLRSAETSTSTASDCDSASPIGSPHAICGPSDNPDVVKTRLRQWAQIVACSVRQSSS
ncbi:uncharacterized protein LOC104418572 [Eucalyptus grandis]|uniref:Uncharacterized protein n=2 Tax=Eucalyptus grandis TaxID=71139 RepID=A0ACC3JD59_EUCGR|nr:uncharacterized protein LOC104418572 [Eucalyptus grandis]KAK3412145.1 hypothetical protein EUGRSUZ_I00927 [Eucalyptus grandis]